MARRKKKNNVINVFFAIILIFLIGILIYKIYIDQSKIDTKKVNNNSNQENKFETNQTKTTNEKDNGSIDVKEKDNSNVDVNEKNEKANEVTTKSSKDETKETKNENARRGGTVILELIGEEEVIISIGSKYKDAGVKAMYSDGSDASSEVEVDNAVDTSKKGTYTVSYYAGNAVVIRRVTVE